MHRLIAYLARLLKELSRMTAYDPRDSESRFQPDGTNKNPWDPYPQYVLEDAIYGTDGFIRPELVPPAAFEAGVSPEVQAAIDVAHDDATAQAANAQATAQQALDTATTGITAVQASAADAADSASAAEAASAEAKATAQQALNLGTGAVGTAVEDYLANVPGLVDENGRLVQWRTPLPEGFLDIDNSHNMSPVGGVYIYRLETTPTYHAYLPAASSAIPSATWTIKNAGAFDFVVDISNGDGQFDDGSSTFTIHSGEAYTLTSDGLGTYFLLNKYAGAAAVQAAPGSVTNFSTTPTDTTIQVSWKAPSAYPHITDYRIETSPDGFTWTTVSDGVSTSPTYTLTGLTPETTYNIKVTPINAVGDGVSSETGDTTLPAFGPPPAPTGLGANPSGTYGQAVRVYWNAINNANPQVTDWELQYSLAGANSWTLFPDPVQDYPNQMDVTGLASSVSYDFQVRAVNSQGAGPWSATVTATSSA